MTAEEDKEWTREYHELLEEREVELQELIEEYRGRSSSEPTFQLGSDFQLESWSQRSCRYAKVLVILYLIVVLIRDPVEWPRARTNRVSGRAFLPRFHSLAESWFERAGWSFSRRA